MVLHNLSSMLDTFINKKKVFIEGNHAHLDIEAIIDHSGAEIV
jgi:hypothetical protein